MLRYAITDRLSLAASIPESDPAGENALVQQARRLAETGVEFLQLREKDLEPGALATLSRRLVEAIRTAQQTSGGRTRLLINSRADVAVATGADGVHLTSSPAELTPAQVRQLYWAAGLAEPVVSVSCHTLEEVTGAAASGASLILFAPVFEKCIGDRLVSPGVGVEMLAQACRIAAPVPVLALGGVTRENAPAALAAGAAGIAAIRLFFA